MSNDDEDVGYGKPPKHSRFKKGHSGNPRGRPKGARNFPTEVAAVLNSKVTVIQEGKPKSLSTVEAALLRLKEKALKGELRALDRLLVYAQEASDTSEATSRERRLSKLEKDIVRRFDLSGETQETDGSGDE